ncbi:Putative universal stress protein [Anatilimnocola aggregata]|uniref:Universal stress protein n=1 Tax=Anatilimnocola aggregata TaxID=2528021 RepID=A0A517YKD1_9BACT|nr:universal stress protein [Anatilimnocola aggregata]QDU30679.1 Putative universal stress protein [Anatilimnocola aggregata]
MALKILVPVDFSTGAEQALQLATSLARDHQGELVLLHVEEPPMVYGAGDMYYGIAEPNREELLTMLKKVSIDDSRMIVQRHLVVGLPATAIVEFAANNAIDYIVMPTHGRTGLRRLLMGSVAEEVVRKAPCPVVTVSPKAAKPSEVKEPSPSHT